MYLLPRELALAFGEPEGFQGAYSLKITGRGGSAVFRGELRFSKGKGLWAEGRDAWGRKVFELWADGGLWLLYPAERALFYAPWGERPLCLSFGPRDRDGLPLELRGEMGPFALEVALKDLRPLGEGEGIPGLDPSGVDMFLSVPDPLDFLVP